MFTATLREANGHYSLDVPADVVEKLHLHKGEPVLVDLESSTTDAKPRRRSKYTAEELLAQCDDSLPMSREDREWLDSSPVGRELI